MASGSNADEKTLAPPEGFTVLQEGKARILQRENDVFYNKAQVVNRDLSLSGRAGCITHSRGVSNLLLGSCWLVCVTIRPTRVAALTRGGVTRLVYGPCWLSSSGCVFGGVRPARGVASLPRGRHSVGYIWGAILAVVD